MTVETTPGVKIPFGSPRSRRTFTAAAILAFATGTAYLFSGWMTYPLIFFAPVGGALLLAAFGIACQAVTSPRLLRRITAGVGGAAACLALFFLPYGVRWTLLLAESVRVPLPPGTEAVARAIDPVKWNDKPDWWVYFSTPLSLEQVREFYERSGDPVPVLGRCTEAREYSNSGERRAECVLEFRSENGYSVMRIDDEGSERIVQVLPGYDGLPKRLRHLLKQLR